MILVLVLNELVLPVMALVEQSKPHVSKRSLQRSLNNQILDYKAILDLCENEMMSINFFGICIRICIRSLFGISSIVILVNWC